MEYKKNDILTVTIEDIGIAGEGIGKVNGYTLFIKDAVIGDTVSCKIMKAKKNYAYARLENVLEPSPYRTQPICPFHRQCGGCQIQAMSYEAQLTFKQRKIRNNLIRIGGFAEDFIDYVMEPIVGMEKPFRYRNKAQFPIGTDREGNLMTGFYAGRTHDIISNTDCFLGVEENKKILEIILAYMQENNVAAYDEISGQGVLRHVHIRKGFTSGEIMVCIVINTAVSKVLHNGEYLPNQNKLVSELKKVEGMTSVSLNFNIEKTNVILGKTIRTIWGENTICDTIYKRNTADFSMISSDINSRNGITFQISPLSFYQVNPVQTEKLYSLALEYAGLTGKETVWDLYCGIGTISLFLAGSAKQVYGVETVPQAIEDAKRNAGLNGIKNAEFFMGKAEEVLPERYEKEGIYADVIIVDPPRKGCNEACLKTMLKMQPERIVYVSCDSATLSRDLKILCEGGYEVKRVRGVDQFGQTVHVETVCLLSKLKSDHHIEVNLNMDELDLTSAESKATYEEIKEYVLENSGFKVSSLYIGQVKEKMGIKERENYNISKKEDAKVPKCPADKEKAIIAALKHFSMID